MLVFGSTDFAERDTYALTVDSIVDLLNGLGVLTHFVPFRVVHDLVDELYQRRDQVLLERGKVARVLHHDDLGC